jgi:hypothetical protein
MGNGNGATKIVAKSLCICRATGCNKSKKEENSDLKGNYYPVKQDGSGGGEELLQIQIQVGQLESDVAGEGEEESANGSGLFGQGRDLLVCKNIAFRVCNYNNWQNKIFKQDDIFRGLNT